MKFALLAALSVLPLSGAAYPVTDPVLTKNPLYRAGPLQDSTCAEQEIRPRNRADARAYIDAVITCLERTWQQHLTAAGLPFKPVNVKYLAKFPRKWCDMEIGEGDSQSWYCGKTSTIAVQLGNEWLNEPGDLWLFSNTATMYAMHVQQLVGIGAAYDAAPYRNKAELSEQIRRYSLQNDCLAGAFMKSVWPLPGRTDDDWDYLLSLFQGDEAGRPREWGKASTIKAWTKRGFAQADPGACNTWTAPPSKIG
ncbi:hypothetical protein [Nonomuraea sp. NPDC050310]|uniref:hypothetical protein n=1 Tax=Nonomuraea sp. NPDC050310 TaxID=3154935 RepID=UPI0033CAB40D